MSQKKNYKDAFDFLFSRATPEHVDVDSLSEDELDGFLADSGFDLPALNEQIAAKELDFSKMYDLLQRQDRPQSLTKSATLDWDRYPIREMIARGWIENSAKAIEEFFSRLPASAREAVLLRKTQSIRSSRRMDKLSIDAWITRIVLRAQKCKCSKYVRGSIDLKFMQALAKQSIEDHAPARAFEILREHGIPLIVEPQLPSTYFDGAAILYQPERPIIGITLRYDRLDNFWFTLMHEIAHISLHSDQNELSFVDDLEVGSKEDPKEREADELASEALVPHDVWKRSPASRLRSASAAQHLAKQLCIHPAIVAGKIRYEWRNYKLLNNLVGQGKVRREFAEG